MSKIHPTSIVERGAELADDVEVGPFCHVGSKVVIGSGTKLLSHVSVQNCTSIGEGNLIFPNAVLGGIPQDLKYKGEDAELVIGDNNQIREHVTMHIGTANDRGLTRVGDHNLIMVGTHVGHDCMIGDHVVIANAVQMAGHVRVEDNAAIGGAAAIHHFVNIGKYAYVGGMSRIVADVPPFMLIEGNPARVRKVNSILLKRHGLEDTDIEPLKIACRMLFLRNDENGGVGRTQEHVKVLEERYAGHQWIEALLTAVRASMNGIHGRAREAQRRDNPFKNPVK
ncbi:Acyl-[acyl-carrier-protein]--UDP-N-acetylglucosamine O-acyltransferase [Poriferisphaera corsica]|uniref:Acyl-[acyl-carrier-protein]--UDP-N-acetylglucosamine O-acyltransferase n=1 Tax=Poriferisphaera corsica TaxID=2528020 RepID=A0A517YPM3_9BACT|nr:acyl-ACP--UDP-N-acetylglucosamine O-acyltransferase [Poriferisphaera corsica]QDU32177.1 Acyl-[acyl-carrier-protein]--UDP-N-acetylglucosamine O-acyltransferase [Poriferisphaera corsica]